MKQSRQENIIYLAVWGLLFAAPLLSLYVRTVSDQAVDFDWTEVFIVWRKFTVYFALFLVHNFLLAPLLVHGHRRVAYFSIVAVVIAAFTVYQCSNRPERPLPLREGSEFPPERMEWKRPHDRMDGDHPHDRTDGERPHDRMDGEQPHDSTDGEKFMLPHPHRKGPEAGPPPIIVGEHDIMAVVVLILMLGANLGIKGYFRSRDDRKRLAQLEHENLEQQLEYLRYQINPHFFMNTLNNIHALVDIDPEKAKDTILELSRMMRFVLYEGNKQGVPLSREMDFIHHYVTLMQLRYTDKVRITLDLPAEMPERQIPPLILITFIENAFKHGVSYQRESFIEVKVVVERDELRFSCRNSIAETPKQPNDQTTKHPNDQTTTPQQGGVGLANVRKRLNLLYGNHYDLRIHDDAGVYSVELVIPVILQAPPPNRKS
jgi:two-component sensor histidine kinase